MRIIFTMAILFLLLTGCSSVKRANKALLKGNYTEAIDIAVKRLQKNKANKADYEQMLLLEQAFQKLKSSHTERISFLQNDITPNTYEIYNLYLELDNIQNKIKPLLPLKKADGSFVSFAFENYSNQIIHAKQEHIDALYNNGVKLMRGSKIDNRNAYTSFNQLLELHPNYKDTKKLIRQAHFNGTDFVYVIIQNKTNQVIPKRLQDVLLDFNTYGLDDLWTEFHSFKQRDFSYDYEIVLEFKQLLVSPERVSEKEIPLSKEIVYTENRVDRNGKAVLDQFGKPIKDELKKTLKGTLNQVIQTKSVSVTGLVHYYDLQRNQRTNSYPLQSNFVFENIFAQFKGDSRVLNDNEVSMIKNRAVDFPSNEQMIVDASNDVKSSFVSILKKYKLR